MARFFVGAVLACFALSPFAWAEPVKPETWVTYYGDALPAETFLDYDLVLFDSVSHPPLRPLQNRNKMLLGYLSIGEAEKYRNDFNEIKKLGVLLQENKNWPGHYFVDIRNPKWAKYLIEKKIPEVLFQRFDGLMLDTLDSPLYLGEEFPQQYPGMKEAAINLLKEIRLQYPGIKLMLNRGFEVMPEAADQIDMLLLESTLTDTDSNPKKPKLVPENIYQELVEEAKAAQKAAPNLKIYALDYWQPEDKEGVRNIYATQRGNGFIPYVATIDLQRVVEEPK